MPRRGNVPKRDVLPDPMYNNKVVSKLINQIMLDGKKGTAQNVLRRKRQYRNSTTPKSICFS